MSVIEAIILGAVQGLAEFLPVSSSGHLQIAKEALGVILADNLTFDIMLHVATVLATIVVLWREIEGLGKGVLQGIWSAIHGGFRGVSKTKTKGEKGQKEEAGTPTEGTETRTENVRTRKMNPETAYFLKLLLSMIPVATVGLLLKDQLNTMLSSPQVLLIVGVMMLVTAGLLAFANWAKERQKSDISWRDAFIIGLAQAIAAMPGLSRSGATIATGLVLGNKKTAVAKFSFLMVIIPILGEAFLDVMRSGAEFVRPTGGIFGLRLSGMETLPYVLGFITAFVVGALACKFMIEMVKRSKLIWFSAYCAIVGTATIIYHFAR